MELFFCIFIFCREGSKDEEEDKAAAAAPTSQAKNGGGGGEVKREEKLLPNGEEGKKKKKDTTNGEDAPADSAPAPLISLESLNNPAALEAALGKVAEKIETEKKKASIKKKKSPKKKKEAVTGEITTAPPPKTTEVNNGQQQKVPQIIQEAAAAETTTTTTNGQSDSSPEKSKSINVEDSKNEDATAVGKGSSKFLHLTVEDAEVADLDIKKEWSPVPAPRTRKASSFRKNSPGSGATDASGEKPPIPAGPSPPPPDEPPATTVEAAAAAAAAAASNGTHGKGSTAIRRTVEVFLGAILVTRKVIDRHRLVWKGLLYFSKFKAGLNNLMMFFTFLFQKILLKEMTWSMESIRTIKRSLRHTQERPNLGPRSALLGRG